MMMDYLPHSRFTTIDVRDKLLDGNLLFAQLKLPIRDAHFVSHIPSNLDKLVFQPNVSV